MKETTGNEQLKAALTLLAEELERSKNKEKLSMEALKNIFPYSLYIHLRPDVKETYHGNRDDILNHFIRSGINETNLNEKSLQIQHELKYKNDQLSF